MGVDSASTKSIRAVFVTAVVVAIASGAVLGWVLNSWATSGQRTINGVIYNSDSVALSVPAPGDNSSAAASYYFDGYNFTLWLYDWYSPAGGRIGGLVTAPNGTLVSFQMGGPPLIAFSGWYTFVGPGESFAISWDHGYTAILLVETNL
jgi:hypothetical protein